MTVSDAELSPSLLRNPELDTWIRIHADGTVTLRTGKVEIGQGIKTAIAMIAIVAAATPSGSRAAVATMGTP